MVLTNNSNRLSISEDLVTKSEPYLTNLQKLYFKRSKSRSWKSKIDRSTNCRSNWQIDSKNCKESLANMILRKQRIHLQLKKVSSMIQIRNIPKYIRLLKRIANRFW